MVLFMTIWAVHVYGFTSELLEITPTDLLGLKHRTIAKNSSLLRTQFVGPLPELPAKANALAFWQSGEVDRQCVPYNMAERRLLGD